MDRLEMLSQREQLMEDIDSIISGFFNDTYEGQYPEECEDLTRILCDAVCKNFPTNWWFYIQPILNTLILTIG